MKGLALFRPVVEATRRFSAIPYANEALAIVGLLLAMQTFPDGTPGSVWVIGSIGAAPVVLNAIGMVLVFRANRFINFAQIQFGVFAAVVFDGLVRGRKLLLLLHHVCGSCVSATPGGAQEKVNLVVAAILALAASGLVAVGVYVIVVRRFASSPVLVSTIVTLFAAQALSGAQGKITSKLVSQTDIARGTALPTIVPQWDHTWTVAGFPVHGAQVVLVALVPIVLVAMALYLRRSDTGVAIRAAADNPQRAQTLGVDVAAVTSRVWVLAGLLSGLAAILPAMLAGAAQSDKDAPTTIPVGQLVVILTVLVLARFSNIWFAALGALVLSVLQSAVQLSYSSQAPLDAGFVFLVGALLLLQRERTTRATREDFSGLDVTRELRAIPHELRSLPTVRTYVRSASSVGALILLGLPWALSVAKTSLLVDALGLVIVGLSILVLTGWAGQVSLGQFGFAAIGAWAAASSGWPFPLALLLAAVAGAMAAVIVGLPAMKLKGLSLAISTIAFAVSAQTLFLDQRYLGTTLPSSLPAPNLVGFDLSDEKTTYYVTLAIVGMACAVVLLLRRTRTGRVLIALRANEATAQSFGINPLRARLTAFSVSGAMSAVAGALLAFHLGRVAPEAYTADKSLVIFLYTVVGGLGGIAGPILGMAFYACVFFFFNGNELVQYAAAGTGAVLLMMLAPGGLAQLAYQVRDAMLRRVAFRLRIPVPSLMGDKGAVMTLDRAPLDEKREGPRRPGELRPLRYQPAGQWALARYGSAEGTKERVGG